MTLFFASAQGVDRTMESDWCSLADARSRVSRQSKDRVCAFKETMISRCVLSRRTMQAFSLPDRLTTGIGFYRPVKSISVAAEPGRLGVWTLRRWLRRVCHQ